MTSGWWGDKIAFINPDGSIVLVMANASENDYEATVRIGGMAGNDTLKVEFPAHSVNTLVVTP